MAEHNQQFKDFEQWVSKASSWLTRHPAYNSGEKHYYERFTAICFDTSGAVCTCGADFMRARDKKRFPVRWVWPDQIPHIVLDVLAGRTPDLPHIVNELNIN